MRTAPSPGFLARPALLVVLAGMLAACGFTLRGADRIADSLPGLYLNLQQPNGEFARVLRRSLANADVDILSDGSGMAPVLSVSAEQLVVRPVTVTPSARAAQYDIRMGFTVSLAQGNAILLGPEDLLIQQVYYEDTENIVGNLGEVETIQREMRQDLVDQLMSRLAAIDTRQTQ